jgi:uncharacterized membrane protein (GlpM family)
MTWIFTKYFITAAVVVLVSELAKRSDKLGGLVAALPLVTILTLIWLYVENQPTSKIANPNKALKAFAALTGTVSNRRCFALSRRLSCPLALALCTKRK